MKISVIKNSINHSDYRTPLEEIDGMPKKPVVGEPLLLTSSTFVSGGIITSNVVDVIKNGKVWTVMTNNSEYLITELD